MCVCSDILSTWIEASHDPVDDAVYSLVNPYKVTVLHCTLFVIDQCIQGVDWSIDQTKDDRWWKTSLHQHGPNGKEVNGVYSYVDLVKKLHECGFRCVALGDIKCCSWMTLLLFSLHD